MEVCRDCACNSCLGERSLRARVPARQTITGHSITHWVGNLEKVWEFPFGHSRPRQIWEFVMKKKTLSCRVDILLVWENVNTSKIDGFAWQKLASKCIPSTASYTSSSILVMQGRQKFAGLKICQNLAENIKLCTVYWILFTGIKCLIFSLSLFNSKMFKMTNIYFM